MSDTHALPAELTIYTVGELHAQWLTWLDADGRNELQDAAADEVFTLDGSAVQQADTAGVQLLLSLATALKQRGRRLALLRPSTPLQQVCKALGLGDWLGRLDQAQTEAA